MMNSPALQTIKQHADKYFLHTEKILDIGCGPGDITLEIAKRTREVYGTDISEGMIEVAKQKALKQNITHIHFIRTDLSDISFAKRMKRKLLASQHLRVTHSLPIIICRSPTIQGAVGRFSLDHAVG